MPDDHSYLKGHCDKCQGAIEFPADGLGVTITCPHCGGSTMLKETVVVSILPVQAAVGGTTPRKATNLWPSPWIAGGIIVGAAVYFLAAPLGTWYALLNLDLPFLTNEAFKL